MSNLNYKETGQVIRVNVGKDISTAIPSMVILPEVGDKKTFTDGVTIPAIDVTVGLDTFLANEYIEYTTTFNDLDFVGRWKKKAFIEYSADNVEQTDYIKFRVVP